MLEKSKFVLSLDIGGANTKTSFLCLDLARYKAESEPKYIKRYKNILKFSHSLFYQIKYFPFWQRKKTEFKKILATIREKAISFLMDHINQQYSEIHSIFIKNSGEYFEKTVDGFHKKNKPTKESVLVEFHVVITITAELSDAFSTKKEGITVILQQLQEIFNPDFLKIITVEGKLIPLEEALLNYLSVSASNWVATSLVFGERERLGILLDMGSTTLDIIPIKDGQPVTVGKNDVDRLLNYELYYTGVLRPPVSSIVKNVPLRHTLCPISFERFALMADVYSVLNLITEQDYTCDTADGRGKSKKYCYARLARVVCGDMNLISEEEIDDIAGYIYKAHKELVQDAIRRAINEFTRRFVIPISKIRFNVTGLGAKIVLIPALKNLNIHDNQIFFKALTEQEHILSTAICLGIVFLKQEVQEFLSLDKESR
jgi:probable H4MPT-linked C1 transfer pathway protein